MVFVAAQETSIFEQMEEGAVCRQVRCRCSVAANMVMHEGKRSGAGEWFRKLRDIGIAAVIVSDLGLDYDCSNRSTRSRNPPSTSPVRPTMKLLSSERTWSNSRGFGPNSNGGIGTRFANVQMLRLRPLSMEPCVFSFTQVAVRSQTT